MPFDPAVQPLPIEAAASFNSSRSAPAWRGFALFALALCLCFGVPLYELVHCALKSEMYSHILLIPFITLYLIRLKLREQLTPSPLSPTLNRNLNLTPTPTDSTNGSRFTSLESRSNTSTLQRFNAALPFFVGLALLAGYWIARWRSWQPGRDDYLAFTILAFLCFLIGGGVVFLGSKFMRAVTFPAALLLFMVPFPIFVKKGIEIFFQHTSADAAAALFSISGTPLFRDGLTFQLPGMMIRVAEECSGIRSSLVLFITGLLAAYLFLQNPWKRAALALFVIPLGIVRNGFRIFTIGMLCVHVDPNMINSPLHRRGGPIFFLLSLIPFFLMLVWLRQSEARSAANAGSPPRKLRDGH